MICPSIYAWNIEFSEETNFLQAMYIDMLLRIAERKLGTEIKKILDIPCGYGRHHPYLRELGYEVWGSDINEELIEYAKKVNKIYY